MAVREQAVLDLMTQVENLSDKLEDARSCLWYFMRATLDERKALREGAVAQVLEIDKADMMELEQAWCKVEGKTWISFGVWK